jgi:hypothetical protein
MSSCAESTTMIDCAMTYPTRSESGRLVRIVCGVHCRSVCGLNGVFVVVDNVFGK